jgi:hypothetical protein
MKMNGAHRRGVGECLKAAAPPTNNEIKKKHSFVDMMLSNVLRDLPFSQTHPLKMADD